MNHRSPIEMMVDKACGFDPSAPIKRRAQSKGKIRMECEMCETYNDVSRHPAWPRGTSKILLYCPKCTGEKGISDVRYFDKSGKELAL